MDSKWTDAGKVLALKSDFKAVGLNNVGSSAPSNPEEGEGWFHSTDHFIRWYNGSAWNAISVYIGTAAPGTPVEGLLWYDTTNNFLKGYDGAAWSTLGTFVGTGAPGTPVEGLCWYDSTNNILKVYDGAAWSSFAVFSGTAAPATPIEGLVWYDTTNHYFKGYDGSGWTSFSTFVGTAAPGTPVEGLFWYDSDNNLPKVYNGSGWDTILFTGNADIGQGELKTDTEEETADVATATATIFTFSSVGSYGFYPQIKFEADTEDITVKIYENGAGEDGPTSYQTSIYLEHATGDARNCYVQIRYVTASGEIYWLFILQDKETKKFFRMHGCPDHPAICCHDVEAVHHPFYDGYIPEKHNLFCIPLMKKERAEIEELREWKNELPGLTFLETVKKYFDIDENPKDAKWPDIPVTIGLDRKRREMKAKIPQRDYIKQARLIKKSI